MPDDLAMTMERSRSAAPAKPAAAPLSLLAAPIGGHDDETAIALACEISARHGGTVTVVNAFDSLTAAGYSAALARAPAAAQVWRAIDQGQAQTRREVETLTARQAQAHGLGVPGEARSRMRVAAGADSAWLALMRELPLADLAILPQGAVSADGIFGGPLAPILIEAKTPVMVARSRGSFVGKPAAVAWDGGLEAGRAIRAALPLLRDASEILVLQDAHGLHCSPGEKADPARAVDYLEAHGLGPVSVAAVDDARIGAALLEAAARADVALLVSGAYRHNRFGEAIFGGATHAFLKAADGPHLVLAH
ncbi:MAG TPA: universal stress protein [Caulobacteraceae bacterium]|nr:universal stress protein [Caulobacteraceae bacterium]